MKEKGKKKIVPVLLAILMIEALLSGCGGMAGSNVDNADEVAGNKDSVGIYENSDNSKFSDNINENQSNDGATEQKEETNNGNANDYISENGLADDVNSTKNETMEIDSKTGKDKYQTDPVPEGKPIPIEPQDVVISDTEYSCTISISCATILDNFDELEKEKQPLVPEDGWILKPTTVTFYDGESVFNILQRICKQNKIHMEFQNTPIYNSAYIEGINNLYEFDCGNLSGWMYSVNDWFPNYGCSRYQLKDGDIIEWIYTCDLGADIGGSNLL